MTLKKTEAYEDAKFSAPFVFYKCSHLHVLFHATPKGMISLVQNYKILLSSFRVWLDLNHGLNGKIFIDFSGLWTNPHIPPAYAFPSMVLTENGVSFALAKKKKKKKYTRGPAYLGKLSWYWYRTVSIHQKAICSYILFGKNKTKHNMTTKNNNPPNCFFFSSSSSVSYMLVNKSKQESFNMSIFLYSYQTFVCAFILCLKIWTLYLLKTVNMK